jgi:TolA-binding protein
MTSRSSSDPRRWREAASADSGVEAEIGAAIRAAASAPPWNDLRVAHVRQRVVRGAAGGHEAAMPPARAFRRRPAWALAVACVLLGAAASALAGYAIKARKRQAPPAATVAGATMPGPKRARASVPLAKRLPPVAETTLALSDAAPAAETTPAPAPAATRARLRRSAAPPAEAPVAAAGAAPPRGEAEELAEALRLLRGQDDAPGALARLDDFQMRHPTAMLAREAVLARVEALLSLGRDAAALEALDGLALDGADVDRPVALARAELRAAAGRCAGAIADFTRARGGAGDGNDAVAARALYGEGVCHLRAADRSAARAAFEMYVSRFPDGPRRSDVDRALADMDR